MFSYSMNINKLSPWCRIIPALAVLALLALAGLDPALAGPWQGQEIAVDGVTHVKNPAQGMEPAKTIELEEIWRLGGDTDNEDEFFGIITSVLIDEEGSIYLLDSQLSEIKIFSADGEFQQSIGREGEGPGEFRGAAGMFFTPDGNIGVIQTFPGKIVKLGKDGTPAGDQPFPQPEGGGFSLLMGGRSEADMLNLLIGVNQMEEGKMTQTLTLTRVGAEGEALAEYCSQDRVLEFSNALFDEAIWDGLQNRWAMGSDGRVYACETWGEYAISVWTPDGKKQRVIEREYKHRKRSAEEIERIEGIFEVFLRQVPNATMDIKDVDHDVFRMFPRDNGSLWVNTSYGSADDLPEDILGGFDVFDADGRFLREVTLKGEGTPGNDGFFFVEDRLYVVTGFLEAAMAAQGGGAGGEEEEEDAEPMAVICYKLSL